MCGGAEAGGVGVWVPLEVCVGGIVEKKLCGIQNNGLLKHPYPTPQNLSIYYITWQRRLKVAHGMKVAN